jgi:hypothetical protein
MRGWLAFWAIGAVLVPSATAVARPKTLGQAKPPEGANTPRVFKALGVGSLGAQGGPSKNVYIISSVKQAVKLSGYVSSAARHKVETLNYHRYVAVAVFSPVDCIKRFHVIGLVRTGARLIVVGETVVPLPGFGGCAQTIYGPHNGWEVVSVPRRVIGVPLPRNTTLAVAFAHQPDCLPPAWGLYVPPNGNYASDSARLNAAVDAAKKQGLIVRAVGRDQMAFVVDGDRALVEAAIAADPDISSVFFRDWGTDPWACLGAFP